MNYIKQLEELAFATRLKLLTERLIQDGIKVYRWMNIDFEPRWFAIFYLLNNKSPLSVTEIASELEISQPAVTQLADLLIKKGYITNVKDKNDTRKHLLELSKKGKALIPVLEPVWQSFKDATRELFKEADYDIMLVLSKLESALDEKDMFTRITGDIKSKQIENIRIIEYRPELNEYFRNLNYEWLNRYFSVEEADEKLLSDPENIIHSGGNIFFAEENGNIRGTAALVKHDDGTYELTKMAVKEKYRGRQIGRKLAEAIIDKSKALGASKIILETSMKLVPAYNLYSKLGFKQVEYPPGEKTGYKRSTIKMELNLK